MKDIFVNLGPNSYTITIGGGILDRLNNLIPDMISDFAQTEGRSNKAIIITDSNVEKIYGSDILKAIEKTGFDTKLVCFKAGEDQKNISNAQMLYESFFDHKMDRKSLVVALGGGVVGDLAGFAASTFMRGVPYVQIPTTLLSQVDSSVGGKTGINHPRGKNMIGSFYQPKAVFIDADTLTTLPKEELIVGFVEVIKYGMIRSKELFEYLEKSLPDILNLDKDALIHIIFNSCKIKAEVVEEDEKEGAIRAILNYGHTIGHAIETLTGYHGYKHGEAVGVGMLYASKIAKEMGLVDDEIINRQKELIKRLGLRTESRELDPKKIVEKLYQDKKTIGGRLRFILPESIGKVVISDKVNEDIIYKALE